MLSLPAESGARPLRILLLTDCYAPTVNGVVRSVIDLREGLIAEGHDVRVLTFGENLRSIFDDGVYRLASIPAGAVYPHARLGRPACPKVRRHVAEWSPDVVHSHTEFPAFRWARAIARRLGVPHVHTYHTLYEDYTHYFCPSRRLGRSMIRTWTRDVLNRPDRVIAPTSKVADVLRGYGVGAPIDVIGTGVNLGRFRPTGRAELAATIGLAPDAPVVLTVGRTAAEKNLAETLCSPGWRTCRGSGSSSATGPTPRGCEPSSPSAAWNRACTWSAPCPLTRFIVSMASATCSRRRREAKRRA